MTPDEEQFSMVHLSTATPERFSELAPDPAADLARLQGHLARGSVRPAHLMVADIDGTDVARVTIISLPGGTNLAHAFQVPPDRSDIEGVYRVLLDGVAEAARSAGLATVETTVVDADEPAPRQKRAALVAAGWSPDGDRLELTAQPVVTARPDDVVEVDPSDPRVVTVIAAAMAESLDDYDRDQVAALGARDAAVAYRDMMSGGALSVPWLAHLGPEGLDGIAAIQPYPDDWCLGYLGVAPVARRRGVGVALSRAMLAATSAAGVGEATASVAVANDPIRVTLERVGFTLRSPRTDFVLQVAG
ncbi:hypothetical protein V2J52_02915 [Georgenia sp. MJ173]|uniref:GNAT family N-acetyltransferase n=1 Tax=Georgenia sunbinii TaxID=3117728 RepID=UPI002F26B4AE